MSRPSAISSERLRAANASHLSLGAQGDERDRALPHAALGGHVTACENCDHAVISYNSCRDRHCPKCQGAAARTWLAEREAELLPAGYFHLVFTLPKPIADIAYQNKRVIYDLLFKASAEATITVAADKKHLGARIGITSVLHSWGSAMTHHPHVHMIVPGGGLSMDGSKWVACRPRFFLPVRVLSRLFRGLILKGLKQAHADGRLQFFNNHQALTDKAAFHAHLKPLYKTDFAVHAKEPFAGPKAVLAYLSRYTHRVAIANRRLISVDDEKVTFSWKDYRVEGAERFKVMTLSIDEFIRRFLIHVFPKRFHRIRHYGLLANGNRANNVALARRLLAAQNDRPLPDAETEDAVDGPKENERACPACGGRMIIIETFEPDAEPTVHYQRAPPQHRSSPS